MVRVSIVAILLFFLAGMHQISTAAESPSSVSDNVLSEIDDIVRTHFYSEKQLTIVDWNASVAQTQKALTKIRDPGRRARIINELLSKLGASHTSYYLRSDPAYWQMAGIFEPVIENECSAPTRPPIPVVVADVGVFWKQIEEKWFVGGIYAKGPAATAGIKVGDEITSANGSLFSPVDSFAGKAGIPVELGVRRTRGADPIKILIVPENEKPHAALLDATKNSEEILSRQSKRIKYIHVWSWTSAAIQQVVIQALTKANQEAVDGIILDLRDGWGGASPNYLTVFDQDVPVLVATERDGKKTTYDSQIRKPTIVLINRGTRSGKEIIAYGVKKHHLARLVGEPTAGAVAFGEPFCLHDGSLLYLAVEDATVDGERLEGVGVAPDVNVIFDFRYTGGNDTQLERAMDLLTGS